MYGKIDRKEVMSFINDIDAQHTAKEYFGQHQPHIWQTGYYSAPSWNWSYQIGITNINGTGENTIQSGTRQYFEVVTQFGEVVAARKINIEVYD